MGRPAKVKGSVNTLDRGVQAVLEMDTNGITEDRHRHPAIYEEPDAVEDAVFGQLFPADKSAPDPLGEDIRLRHAPNLDDRLEEDDRDLPRRLRLVHRVVGIRRHGTRPPARPLLGVGCARGRAENRSGPT